ncbi:MAG: NTP transferase domain-containing protein [Planctomycetes bacterium]|nr:NTP transferase domain-containing protein [Planctomycetota bacterium]
MNPLAATTAGVLLAAGRGRRMGTLKQVLPWGDTTVVAAAFDCVSGACAAGMFVVVGADGDRVVAALADRVFERVDGDSDAEQIDSARRGIERALARPNVERVLLHPADHPASGPDVAVALLRHAADDGRVLIPTHQDHGGHPVLVPATVARDLLGAPATDGLRGYWRAHPQLVRRIEFADAPGLTADLDTPDDYESAMA